MKSNDASGEQIKKKITDRDRRINAHKSMALEATENTMVCGGCLPCLHRPADTEIAFGELNESLMIPDSMNTTLLQSHKSNNRRR